MQGPDDRGRNRKAGHGSEVGGQLEPRAVAYESGRPHGARRRTAPARMPLGRPRIERRLQVLERAPAAAEKLGQGAACGAHPALDLPLVRARGCPVGIDREAARPGEGLEGRIEHGRGAGPLGHAGFEIVDPHPERHPTIALEQGQVARLPRELRPRRAYADERRPAMRERADKPVQRLRLPIKPRGDVEPVVLCLHAA